MAVEKAGFAKYIQNGIALQLGQRGDLAIKLKVSSPDETITVSREAPLINTTKSEVGINIDSKRISELPLAPNRTMCSNPACPLSRHTSTKWRIKPTFTLTYGIR